MLAERAAAAAVAAAASGGRQRWWQQGTAASAAAAGEGAHTITWLVVKAIASTCKAGQLKGILCKKLCKRGSGILEKLGVLVTQCNGARACKNKVGDSFNMLLVNGGAMSAQPLLVPFRVF